MTAIDSIGYVILFVKDVPASAEWYRANLGVGVKVAMDQWAELETKGTTLALHGLEGEEVVPFHHPGVPEVVFNVDDVAAAHATLKERGVKIHDLKEVWSSPEVVGVGAEFHDPDGNRLGLHGTVPRATWKAPATH